VCWWKRGKPSFHDVEALIIRRRRAQALAQLPHFTSEDRFQFHHFASKLSQRHPEKGPRPARSQADPDEMHKTRLVDYDRRCPLAESQLWRNTAGRLALRHARKVSDRPG
jgi:hypothetical protein